MRRIIPIAVLVLVALFFGLRLLPRYGPPETPREPVPEEPQAQQFDEDRQIGIVLSVGGRGDKSFNDAAIRGLEQARDELGITFRDIEPREMASDEEALRFLVDQGFDLVIGVGFLMEEALQTVARDNPDTRFAIIDAVVDEPNVSSLVFKEHEGSFLAGALAAMVTETNTLGFVGGMDVPLIMKFQIGYEEGIRHINPDAQILVNYAGSDAGAFNNPARGKELALAQFDRGADIIYHAAGGTGAGVIDAAEERDLFAIGVDSNQDDMAPGNVLTSMLKRVDVAVFNTVEAVVNDEFTAGIQEFGVADDGVGLTDFEYTRDQIPDEALARLGEIRDQIAAGEIRVPSTPEEREEG